MSDDLATTSRSRARASAWRCPDPAQRLPHRADGPRRRRPADADADRRDVRQGLRQPGARRRSTTARCSTVGGERLAFSTDSFVVRPLFFPGGDIGSLAVHGTVNDLAMCGARPLAIAAGFILEEGFPMEDLWRVVDSMRRAADAAGVPVVTGDTKVVDRGKGDGVYINTTGIGVVPAGIEIDPRRARAGRRVLLSGADRRARHRHHVGARGARVRDPPGERLGRAARPGRRAARRGRRATSTCCATRPAAASPARSTRSPPRRGSASASRSGRSRVAEEVRGACEILGFDPLYVANEGKCLAPRCPRRPPRPPPRPRGGDRRRGRRRPPGKVFLRSRIGGLRVVDMLSGEQLPRIC